MSEQEKPDFETLRAKRNEAVHAIMRAHARELGLPDDEPIRSTFDPNACYCDCAGHGPCEHKWDGEPYESEDGSLYSATCSRCGMLAYSHSLRVGP